MSREQRTGMSPELHQAAMPWERDSSPWAANLPFLVEKTNKNPQFWWAKDVLCLIQRSNE